MICELMLIPKAIVFFGIFLVLLVNEIKVILFISPSLSKLSWKIGPITILIPCSSNSLADSYVFKAFPLLSLGKIFMFSFDISYKANWMAFKKDSPISWNSPDKGSRTPIFRTFSFSKFFSLEFSLIAVLFIVKNK